MRLKMKAGWSRILTVLLILAMCSMPAAFAAQTDGAQVIYGDGNENMVHEIDTGGVYVIGEGATGIITINTADRVTLVGQGSDNEQLFRDLSVECMEPGSRLTLQDVGIYYDGEFRDSVTNLINFTGMDNELTVEGTCLLDYDVNVPPSKIDAGIHVPNDASLTLNGSGTLYMYKYSQGAGIGGNSGEMNGAITFAMTGSVFMKGSKQGAVIGAGAGASSGTDAPGPVVFLSGTYNLISNSRGAIIGGSAGSTGGSTGTAVYVRGGSINANCDFTGAAIGGGGYQSGNDASGGTVYITGGSLRTYIDKNAASNEHGGFNNAIFTEGINDAVITAQRLNENGEKVYKCVLDTAELGDGPYTVLIDGEEYYSGDRHRYSYINEATEKGQQIVPDSTKDNWVEGTDTNLYFYLTGEDHEITVGGNSFTAVLDADRVDEEGNIIDSRVYTEGAFHLIQTAAGPAFKTNALVLSGQIGVNFYMDLPGDPEQYSDSFMEFTVNGNTSMAAFDSAKMNVGKTYYEFTCYINAVSMADRIRAVYHWGDQMVSRDYSVLDYINKFEENRNLFDDKTIRLVEATADYGHYVQPFLAAARGWVIGEDHAQMMEEGFSKSYDFDAIREAVASQEILRDKGDSDFSAITYALALDAETSIYVYFRPAEGYTGGTAAVIDGTPAALQKQSDGRYFLSISNISAHRLDDRHTILVQTDSGTAAVEVSALSYVQTLLNAPSYQDNADALNAMAAFYQYSAAAEAMKAS